MNVILHTRICTDCGQEIETGLRNTVNHFEVCKKDSPNENIESHKYKRTRDEREKKENDKFKPIWDSMTIDEQSNLTMLSMLGFKQGDYIVMGRHALKRVTDFKEELIVKYSIK